MTATALYPAPHISLISLTRDDSVRPARVAQSRQRTSTSLLARVAQGDAVAARDCIDEFGGLVWSIARRLASNQADAEDAVQEIFNDVFRSAARFDPSQGSERVFVTMIARRRLIDRMRHAAHQRPTESVDIQSRCWVNGGPGAGACGEAMTAAQAVMQLRPELQRVLELGILRGLSHAEIADVLQLPVETVKARMRRGLIQVREWMGNPAAASEEV